MRRAPSVRLPTTTRVIVLMLLFASIVTACSRTPPNRADPVSPAPSSASVDSPLGAAPGSAPASPERMRVTVPVEPLPSRPAGLSGSVSSVPPPAVSPSSVKASSVGPVRSPGVAAGSSPAGPPSPPPPGSPPGSAAPPQAFVTVADQLAAARAVAAMTPAERAGSVIMASSADAVGTDLVRRLHLGGVILMGREGTVDGTTGGTPTEVAAVTAALAAQAAPGAPLLIGTDQEYGDVVRLVNGFTAFPGASVLAGRDDPALVTRVAAAAAAELLAVGVNVDFAPDADLLPPDGASAIGDRSYGSDPHRVATFVAAAVRGYQSAGLVATLKHFPGIGRLATDTHTALPSLDTGCADWNAAERVPMAAGVAAGVAMVMTGHVRLPAVGDDDDPTSLSPDAVTDLLRGSGRDGCRGLGFTGVAVTDSLQMAPVADRYGSGAAAVRALQAGQDLLLMPVNPAAAVAGITAAVTDGALPAARLAQAATRVYALRLATSRVPRPGMDVVDSAAHRALARQAGGPAVSG